MARLDPLIRVRKHAVEQKQKFLSDLYRQMDALVQTKQNYEETLQQEEEAAQQNPSAYGYKDLAIFTAVIRHKIEDIIHDMRKLETRIHIAREDMRESFAELKKVQIVARTRQQTQKKVQEKKESKDLDEIGIQLYQKSLMDSISDQSHEESEIG